MKEPLSNRELVVSGLYNKEIALALKVSIKTVEHHRQMIFYKLEVSSVVALIRVVLSEEIVSFDDFFAATAGNNSLHTRPCRPLVKKQ
jgi:DNA-binding CsgD family transcriptional regulator